MPLEALCFELLRDLFVCIPSVARELQQLINILNAAHVAQPVQDHLITNIKASSIFDFLGLVKADTHEDDLVTTLEKPTPLKGDLLQRSRIRAAWRAARVVLQKAEGRKVAGLSEDMDEPLDESTHTELTNSFQNHHHFTFCMFTRPSDALVGRSFRENQRLQATVIQIRKVQSLAASAMPAPRE